MMIFIDLPNWQIQVAWYILAGLGVTVLLHLLLILMNKVEEKYGNN